MIDPSNHVECLQYMSNLHHSASIFSPSCNCRCTFHHIYTCNSTIPHNIPLPLQYIWIGYSPLLRMCCNAIPCTLKFQLFFSPFFSLLYPSISKKSRRQFSMLQSSLIALAVALLLAVCNRVDAKDHYNVVHIVIDDLRTEVGSYILFEFFFLPRK